MPIDLEILFKVAIRTNTPVITLGDNIYQHFKYIHSLTKQLQF